MISVIIVTYNSREHIGRCLESFRGTGAELIVVDNGSADGTAELVGERFPEVKLIAAGKNLGFAAACNRGASEAAGSALLFANPDVIRLGPLDALEQALESAPNVAAAAPRLVDAEGRTQAGFNVRSLPTPAALIFEVLLLNRLFPRNPVNREYRCLSFDYEHSSEVEQPAGACLLVRRSSFEGCGGFDESFYPLWFEDADLCLRLRRSGKILYCPQVRFEHLGGHSLESITFSERQVYWYRNLFYYVEKHFSWPTGIAVRAAVLLGVSLRLVAEVVGLGTSTQTRPAPRGQRVGAYWKAAKLSLLGWR